MALSDSVAEVFLIYVRIYFPPYGWFLNTFIPYMEVQRHCRSAPYK